MKIWFSKWFHILLQHQKSQTSDTIASHLAWPVSLLIKPLFCYQKQSRVKSATIRGLAAWWRMKRPFWKVANLRWKIQNGTGNRHSGSGSLPRRYFIVCDAIIICLIGGKMVHFNWPSAGRSGFAPLWRLRSYTNARTRPLNVHTRCGSSVWAKWVNPGSVGGNSRRNHHTKKSKKL